MLVRDARSRSHASPAAAGNPAAGVAFARPDDPATSRRYGLFRSKTGTEDSRERVWRGGVRRGLGVWLAAVAMAGTLLAAWIYLGAREDAARVRRDLRALEAEAYTLGVQARADLWRMDGRLLRFQLSGASSERESFLREANGWATRMASSAQDPSLADREPAAVDVAARAFEAYLGATAGLLERDRPTVRRDTAERVASEIAAASKPVFEACERLVEVQRATWAGLMTDAGLASRSAERRMTAASLLLVVVLACLAGSAWVAWVRPLRAELGESRRAQARQDGLAELGTLAAGVVHEIRNPLAAMKTQLHALRDAGVGATGEFDLLGGEIRRLERILDEFLQLARPGEPSRAPCDAGRLLEAVASLVQRPLQERGVQLHCVSEEEPRVVLADPEQVRQILLNLVRNAADSMPGGGRITLRARAGMDTRDEVQQPMVMLEVEDTGTGIAPEVEARLFEPFASTKPGGTGLGLSIAARLARANGGHLQYRTQPGRGTVFALALPRVAEEEEAA